MNGTALSTHCALQDSSAWSDFVEPAAIARMVSGISLVLAMRNLTPYLKEKMKPDKSKGEKETSTNRVLSSLLGPIVMIAPVLLFWIIVLAAGISVDELQETKWLYEDQESTHFYSYFSKAYDFGNYDSSALNGDIIINFMVLVFLTVLSAAITLSGFELEVGEDEALSKDQEIKQLGFMCVASGLCAGQVGYHQLGTSINNRIDGGTHRLSCLCAGLMIMSVWMSGHSSCFAV